MLVDRKADFDGTQDYVDLTWPAFTTAYSLCTSQRIDDSKGPVGYFLSSVTSSGCRVNAGARFTGRVLVLISGA